MPWGGRLLVLAVLVVVCAAAQGPPQQLPADDVVRIREFYRLAEQLQDSIWPGWSKVPAPLLLVTPTEEFLTRFTDPPAEFKPAGNDFFARPRQLPVNFLATFPAFGPPAVIVIGEPANTEAKTSTPWVITLMHEHFHQLQDAQTGYYAAVEALGLSDGDKTGMWMLNYPFPYEKPEVAHSFAMLRDLLLQAVQESDPQKFHQLAAEYVQARKKFFAQLSSEDGRYFSFQLWQEGIARYTQIKVAEAAANYQPTKEYATLQDYESFASYAGKARNETLDELRKADLAQWKRTVVYSFGATEGLLLDRMNPDWKNKYFHHLFTLDPLF